MYVSIWGIPHQIDQAEILTIFFSWSQKMTRTNFQILLKIFLVVVLEIVDLTPYEGRYRFF